MRQGSQILMVKYVLEILESKLRVINWYWRNEILSPIASIVTEGIPGCDR